MHEHRKWLLANLDAGGVANAHGAHLYKSGHGAGQRRRPTDR